MKLLSNHVQIFSMIFAFDISLPSELSGAFSYFSSLSPDLTKALSLDCFL